MKMQIGFWLSCLLCMQVSAPHAAGNDPIEVGMYTPQNTNLFPVRGDLDNKPMQYSFDEQDDQKAAELEDSDSLGGMMPSYNTPRGNILTSNAYSSTELGDDDEKKDPDDSGNENDDASSLNGVPNVLDTGLPKLGKIGNNNAMQEHYANSQLTNQDNAESKEKDSDSDTYAPPSSHALARLLQNNLHKQNQPDSSSLSDVDHDNSSDTIPTNNTKKKIHTSTYWISTNKSKGKNNFSRKITFSSNNSDESTTEEESTEYLLDMPILTPHSTKSKKSFNSISKKTNYTPKKTNSKKNSYTVPFSVLTTNLLQRPVLHPEDENDPTLSSDDDLGNNKIQDTPGNMTMKGLSQLAQQTSTESSVEQKVEDDDASDDDLSIKTIDVIPYELFKHQATSQTTYKKIIKPIYYQKVMNNRYSVHSQSYTHHTFQNNTYPSVNNLINDDDILSEKLKMLVSDLQRNKTTVFKQEKQIRRLKNEVEKWKKRCCRTFGLASTCVFVLSGTLAYFIVFE